MINFNILETDCYEVGQYIFISIKYKKILLYTSINNIKKYPHLFIRTLASIPSSNHPFVRLSFMGRGYRYDR